PSSERNVRGIDRFRRLRNRNEAPLRSGFHQGTFLPGEGALRILSTSIDKNAADFRANAERMRALVAELQKRRAEAALGGSEKARERHVGRGKLLPRDRVMNLIDPTSPFLEFSPLAA